MKGPSTSSGFLSSRVIGWLGVQDIEWRCFCLFVTSAARWQVGAGECRRVHVGGGRTGRDPKFCFPVLDLAPSKDRKKLTDQLLSRAFIAPNAPRSSGLWTKCCKTIY